MKDKNERLSMTIPMGKLRHFVKKMESLDDEAPLSFELIMTAFFPNAWHNIQKYSNDCYMSGYFAGKKAAEEENENKGNN